MKPGLFSKTGKGIIILTLLFSWGGCMRGSPENKINSVIRKEFEHPVVEEKETPVPGLRHVSIYDKSWLVRDPIIPVDYYQYAGGEVCRTLPLNEIRYRPESREEAEETGFWFLRQMYYVKILHSETGETESGFELAVLADFYVNHPMYRNNPIKNQFVVVSCNGGRWAISDPDIYK